MESGWTVFLSFLLLGIYFPSYHPPSSIEAALNEIKLLESHILNGNTSIPYNEEDDDDDDEDDGDLSDEGKRRKR